MVVVKLSRFSELRMRERTRELIELGFLVQLARVRGRESERKIERKFDPIG